MGKLWSSNDGKLTLDGIPVNGITSKQLYVDSGGDITFEDDATAASRFNMVRSTDTTTAGWSFVLDEDTMTSDSATKLATQQSIKAYADSLVVGSYASFAFHNPAAPVSFTFSASNTYKDVNSTNLTGFAVSETAGGTLATSSASTGVITIGTTGAGRYRMYLKVIHDGAATERYRAAVHIDTGSGYVENTLAWAQSDTGNDDTLTAEGITTLANTDKVKLMLMNRDNSTATDVISLVWGIERLMS